MNENTFDKIFLDTFSNKKCMTPSQFFNVTVSTAEPFVSALFIMESVGTPFFQYVISDMYKSKQKKQASII